jgi:hypothetical protein
MPHSTALGIPISQSATPTSRPIPELSASCARKNRLSLLQVVRPCELDQAIAQLFTLHQREDHENDHNSGRGQRMQQRRNQRRDAFQRRRRRLANLDRDRLGVRARCRQL